MIKKLLLIIFISLRSEAGSFLPGDIILAPMNCYLCKLIEDSTNSVYSHLFIYLGNGDFAHSLREVEIISLEKIKDIVDTKRPILHLRHIDYDPNWGKKLRTTFNKHFKTLPYDKDFLWSNYDERGQEMLYCSEFIVKLLKKALDVNLKTFPMDFSHGRDHWLNYFGGVAPDGMPGVSPAHFERNIRFLKIGKYNLF